MCSTTGMRTGPVKSSYEHANLFKCTLLSGLRLHINGVLMVFGHDTQVAEI